MDRKYKYGQKPGRRRRTRLLIILAVSVLIVGSLVGLLLLDLRQNRSHPVEGASHTVVQALDGNSSRLVADEDNFTMELPSDWKKIEQRNDRNEHSFTWQATKKGEDNRILKLYIDTIPATMPLNRLLPVTVMGNALSVGDVSQNCATFTQGATLNAQDAEKLTDKPAKWQQVDFICNVSRVVENQIGTGSTEGNNAVTIKGEQKGAHKYFFLFTDHNIQPNESIFVSAVKSFKAK